MNDERAGQGLDHLQTAALEMIHAARAFLDVAEELVADQDKVAELADVLGSVASAASRAARGEPLMGPSRRPAASTATGEDDRATGGPGPDGRDGDAGVQHIDVS